MPERTVFTNGCFDILHPGHVDLLRRAKALGTKLIVGLNSDESVRAIKGSPRPYQTAEDRKAVLLALEAVDEVLVFDELTPEKLIERIKPDVLVKGGDWQVDQIVGASFVLERGGEVFSLPLLGDHSTSNIVEAAGTGQSVRPVIETPEFSSALDEHIEAVNALRAENSSVDRCADLIIDTLRSGKKLLICGNGGSAADAQHFAAELVGRFERERRGLPAIALTTDTSALTALANDYGFERVFARQVEALASRGDLLIAISTSGTSPNVIAAVMAARDLGCRVLGMTGAEGKKLAGLSDECIRVPSRRTARIQEAHALLIHVWCEMVESRVRDQQPAH